MIDQPSEKANREQMLREALTKSASKTNFSATSHSSKILLTIKESCSMDWVPALHRFNFSLRSILIYIIISRAFLSLPSVFMSNHVPFSVSQSAPSCSWVFLCWFGINLSTNRGVSSLVFPEHVSISRQVYAIPVCSFILMWTGL